MKKVCIVTGTRAEWGLLSRLAGLIKACDDMQLQVIVTNMHLSKRYGLTYKEIEADGFTIDYKVAMEVSSDGQADTVRSMSLAMAGFADAYQKLKPDLLVVLGDRYEILVAVSAALIFKIPVAHLHGGEITQGAFDDAIRHAITKMSHLHFTATEEYRNRVIQMGEQPDRVFNVGAIGVDNIKHTNLWSKEQTEQSLDGFVLDRNTLLVTFHPVTLEDNSSEKQIDALLNALDELPQYRVIFTMPNSDSGNHIIVERIEQWCERNGERAIWRTSLGSKRYLSVLQYIGMVVGNSSSGITEVPSFGIPTINIGDRQKGRIAAQSVYNCVAEKNSIIETILLSARSPQTVLNPYDKSDSAQNIYLTLSAALEDGINIKKKFFDQK